MRKHEELENQNSCLCRADAGEMLFVLRSHDIAAPATIRWWVSERIRLGKYDKSCKEALECADTMELERLQE